MDPVTAVALSNLGIQIIAIAIDAYRASGATEEQIAELRATSLLRVATVITAVKAAKPPEAT